MGNSGDGCDLVLTLCRYDLRKGDLFVLSWSRERRMRRGSISSELLMCGGCACGCACGCVWMCVVDVLWLDV